MTTTPPVDTALATVVRPLLVHQLHMLAAGHEDETTAPVPSQQTADLLHTAATIIRELHDYQAMLTADGAAYWHASTVANDLAIILNPSIERDAATTAYNRLAAAIQHRERQRIIRHLERSPIVTVPGRGGALEWLRDQTSKDTPQ